MYTPSPFSTLHWPGTGQELLQDCYTGVHANLSPERVCGAIISVCEAEQRIMFLAEVKLICLNWEVF